MGNQQETDKAYIAGILDGEGCIHLSLQCQRNKSGKFRQGTLHHVVQIANTSQILVDYLAKWFDENGIPFYCRWTQPKGKFQKCYAQVRLTRFVGINKFLTLLLPYIQIKRKQAELMLEFVRSRLQLAAETQGRLRPSYSDREMLIMQMMRALNQRGTGPSTTTRETLNSDDIVSSRKETYELR